MILADIEPRGFEKVRCPKCRSAESLVVVKGKDHLYHVPGEYFVSECQGCGFWFQNPRPIADRLISLYPTNYLPHARPVSGTERQPTGTVTRQSSQYHPLLCLKGALKKFILRHHPKSYLYRHLGYLHLPNDPECVLNWSSLTVFDWLKKWKYGVDLTPYYVSEGKLLEIGCGSGGRLLALRRLGWHHLYGIEVLPAAAEQAQAVGFAVECGPVEAILSHYPDGFFDVIVASMVLEHLYNPFEVMHQIAAKLMPGGQFLFSTISRNSLDARMYGDYWGGFDFPRHMVHFRKTDIYDMLGSQFEHVECFHQNATIDFIRSSTWRRECGKFIDRIIFALGESRTGSLFGLFLSWLGLTSRVSFRCLRSPKVD